MKIAVLIARIFLGLVFLVFGMNAFLHYFPMQLPPGVAGQFLGALFQSHEVLIIGGLEAIGGAILMSGFYVPIGLTILGPLIFNILMFHAFMEPTGIVPAFVVLALWLFIFYWHRKAFAGIFESKQS